MRVRYFTVEAKQRSCSSLLRIKTCMSLADERIFKTTEKH